MESKLMPCKVADLIDVIISHNERVGIWVKYRNGDERGCALLWKGMAHELPRQHLNSRFVRIFGLIPETIMDADIINIIVEIPTPMTTSEPATGELIALLRGFKDGTIGITIADRLESQEREIASFERESNGQKAELDRRAKAVTALTARAESAERERDALVKSVDRFVEAWENFKSPALIEFLKQWRGLPQDGEE